MSVPKSIEAVVVDSSAFNAARGDVYRFQVSLRNTGTLETALPALELSLTDSRDDVMLRRVLLPKDFSNAVPALSAGGEWSGSLAVLVPASALPARMTGDQVLAFYP